MGIDIDKELEELDMGSRDLKEQEESGPLHEAEEEKSQGWARRTTTRGILPYVSGFLLLVVAIPLLLIFLIKPPEPGQEIALLGVPYSKAVFLLFLSAALMTCSSILFLKPGMLVGVVLFCLCVSCCFPFIAGLRGHLTLQQAIAEIPLFSDWPFFLRPAYVLIGVLIPLGVICYGFLQIRALFRREPHAHGFLLAAAFLAVTAFLGLSILGKAGQPNILTVARRLVVFDQEGQDASPVARTSVGFGSRSGEIGLEAGGYFAAPNPRGGSQSEEGAVAEGGVANHFRPVSSDTDLNLRLLCDKVDRMMEMIGGMQGGLATLDGDIPRSNATAERGQALGAGTGAVGPREAQSDEVAIGALNEQVQELASKVDRILEAFGRMRAILPDGRENPLALSVNQPEGGSLAAPSGAAGGQRMEQEPQHSPE